MREDDLVCAVCSGRVAEGRCPTCRAARASLREQAPVLPAGPLLLLALVLLAVVLLLG